MKSRFFTRSNFFKGAAFTGSAYVYMKGIQNEMEKWRKQDEQDEAAGVPSSRPWSQQSHMQRERTKAYMAAKGYDATEWSTGTGHPAVTFVKRESFSPRPSKSK